MLKRLVFIPLRLLSWALATAAIADDVATR
jgi:hypothetical protein